MPIGINLVDGYGNLGPLFPDRIARIVYARTIFATDTDYSSGSGTYPSPGSRTWNINIPQLDCSVGFMVSYSDVPGLDNRWWVASYINDSAQPNTYFLGANGFDGRWFNDTKILNFTLNTTAMIDGSPPRRTFFGFMFT